MSSPTTSSTRILLVTTIFVVCVASLVYARALHNHTGVPDLHSVLTGAKGSNDELPWPGTQWLEGFTTKSQSLILNGRQFSSAYEAILKSSSIINPVKNFNAYINSFLIPHNIARFIVLKYGTFWSHHIITYLRNLISGTIVYYGSGLFFHYHCYIHKRSKEIFSNRKRPEWKTMIGQMKLAQASLFIYVMLPGVSEFMIEEGFTRCAYTVEEIGGLGMYFFWTVLYFVLVEIGIYWVRMKKNKYSSIT